jgi:hydratase-aldolase
MLQATALHGICAMMPAFATDDAADFHATSTVHVDNLTAGVDRIIRDGMDAIATTGSFGECHTLLDDELETLTRATVAAVDHRVPLFIGCTSLNTRDVVRKMRMIQDAGADGVLVGVPFYFPSSVDNAVRFFLDIAEEFPRLGIMIYHNPPIHRVAIPTEAFQRLVERPNIVAVKDIARDAEETAKLMKIVKGKIAVFTDTAHYRPFTPLGVDGCWSIEVWMGPWPLLRLRDALEAGDDETARRITEELLTGPGAKWPDASWRETSRKVGMQFTDYCRPGPLRPPFVEIPTEVTAIARQRAAYWEELCARYRPAVGTAAGHA